MAIVKYPEYSVEIVVQEGTGEISNATFSATLDPMSTSNMVLMKKKNTNLKPFIWGVSKWGDSAYNYVPNTYKGISTIGSGKNAVITLTFSQPVDHFTLYFDEVAQSMPLSVTVGDKTFSNDDYQFTYSQETTQTTFTITVNEINTINGVEMPLMIVGIENRIALDITHRTGLRKLRTGHTYTKDKGKPAYGIISQEGALDIFDFYTEIDDLIELGLIDNKMDIKVKFQDNLVGKYTSDKWTEYQTGLFNVSLNDNKLLDWQNITIPRNGFSDYDKTALDLLNYLMSTDESIEFYVDETTSSHLENIEINEYFWDSSTKWEFAQKICDLAQLYIYIRNDGKVSVVSQNRINELKELHSSNPIVIPYKLIDGNPIIDRLVTNKIDNVTCNYNKYKNTRKAMLDTDLLSYYIYKGTGDRGLLSNYTDKIADNKIAVTTKIDGLASSITSKITSGSVTKKCAFYLFKLSPQGIRIRDLVCKLVSDYWYWNIGTGEWDFDIVDETLSEYNSVSGSGSFLEYDSIDDYMDTWFTKTQNGSLYDYTIKMGSTSVFHGGIIRDTDDSMLLAYIIPIYSHNDGLGTLATINLNYQVTFLGITLTTTEQSLNIGSGKNNYIIDINEFMSNKTSVDGILIPTYNANQILSNFTGKQTISFRMATDTLYYKNGTNAYDINLGQTLQELDLVQLRKTDGTYEPKVWQISKVEHEVGGSKWLNIEAVEI